MRLALRLALVLFALIFICGGAGQVRAESKLSFPIGVFAVEKKDLELAKQIGFDVVHEYRFEESSGLENEVQAYLDRAQALGLKVMLGFERQKNEVEAVLRRVQRFKDHPALWAWYLCDEPKPSQLELVSRIAKAIRVEDPKHPSIIASDNPDFLKISDQNFAYIYAVRDQVYPDQNLLPHLRRVKLSAELAQPFFGLTQAFNWNNYLKPQDKLGSMRSPNSEELRYLTYSAILNGARGSFFFSFQTLPKQKQFLNSEVRPLVRELKSLKGFFARGNQEELKLPGLSTGQAAVWRLGKWTLYGLINSSSRAAQVASPSKLMLLDVRSGKRVNPESFPSLAPWSAAFYLSHQD